MRGLDELKIESVLVRKGSRADGVSTIDLRLRSETGALVVGVRREERLLDQFDPQLPFASNDVVYLVGTSEAIRSAMPLFEPAG